MFFKNCVIKIKYENYRFDFLFFFCGFNKNVFLPKRKTEGKWNINFDVIATDKFQKIVLKVYISLQVTTDIIAFII